MDFNYLLINPQKMCFFKSLRFSDPTAHMGQKDPRGTIFAAGNIKILKIDIKCKKLKLVSKTIPRGVGEPSWRATLVKVSVKISVRVRISKNVVI